VKIAWMTDQHGIFLDRHAWDLALDVIRDFKPNAVPVGSDDLDLYTLSRFNRNPARKEKFQDELDCQLQRYAELKDAVDPFWNSTEKPEGYQPVQHPTVLGNHNYRFIKTLWEDPKFFGLRSLEYRNLLNYDKFGFDWKGDPWDFQSNEDWSPFEGLVFTHGNRVSRFPGFSVKNQMAARFYDASLVMGHCHRGAVQVVTRPDGSQLWGVEGFCLCQLNPEYAKNVNWTQGVVLVTRHDSGALEFDLVSFYRANSFLYAYWQGNEYKVSLAKPH
jgi:hypothetical protein